MPELPEVETIRAGAAPHLVGRVLLEVQLRRPDLRWPMPARLLRDLVGRRCTAVQRRSKYLLLRFDGKDQPVAIVHLGMTGRMAVEPIARNARRPPWRAHEHWRMDFGDRLVRYVDARRFGALDAAPAAALPDHRLLRGLGIEPLDRGFDGPMLHRMTRHRRASIKTLLMDARLLVGVGNIYASEACHRAGIRPRRAAGSLSGTESHALARAVRSVLRAAIAAGGTTFRDYVGVHEEAGFFQRRLRVYEREGLPCPRCGATIKRVVQGARSTYYCPGCQR
jgi:formamidopyrimidine-DNA glycosylase